MSADARNEVGDEMNVLQLSSGGQIKTSDLPALIKSRARRFLFQS